jgi:hypothetical protein
MVEVFTALALGLWTHGTSGCVEVESSQRQYPKPSTGNCRRGDLLPSLIPSPRASDRTPLLYPTAM